MDNKDMPACPVYEQKRIGEKLRLDLNAPGLSKRELIAAMAMQGLLSCYDAQVDMQHSDPRYNGHNFKEVVAVNAVEFTDALLKELEMQ
jgi:hypothetical protein